MVGAALVEGLGEEEKDAAFVGGFVAEDVDSLLDGVEDGGSTVAGVGMGERVFEVREVGGEGPLVLGLAVKGDEREAAGGACREAVEQRGEAGVVGELAGAGGASLHEDQDGEGLLVVGLFEGDALGDAVVEEGEVGGAEGVDEVAGGGGDEGGDDYEVGGYGEGGLGEGGRGGEEESEGEKRDEEKED